MLSSTHREVMMVFVKNLDLTASKDRHNKGYERTTKFYAPFKLIYTELCQTRPQCRIREKYWKSGIGKEKLRKLLQEE